MSSYRDIVPFANVVGAREDYVVVFLDQLLCRCICIELLDEPTVLSTHCSVDTFAAPPISFRPFDVLEALDNLAFFALALTCCVALMSAHTCSRVRLRFGGCDTLPVQRLNFDAAAVYNNATSCAGGRFT